ncbi:MAG: hypothetical protein KVP17_003934 [Porospora cf. gigantea B]|uniref:uncharacterized protein n=1 Tax=Porospora cf. gigantea B TaxID=2853592 RepID=UPI003571D96E|nr:MAG: hypothetical protein KVP17_003934 [Porospora cf. gigantea B]
MGRLEWLLCECAGEGVSDIYVCVCDVKIMSGGNLAILVGQNVGQLIRSLSSGRIVVESLMDNKQKMIDGQEHSPGDPKLAQARLEIKTLCQKFNTLPYEDVSRRALMNQILGTSHSFVEPPFWLDYPFNFEVGNGFYANHGCTILNSAPVTIGRNVLFGPGVTLATPTHPYDPRKRSSGAEVAKPIFIDDDCWLGANVTVLPGVTIGRNCIVAAGSVVTRSLPNDSICGGVPAKTLRAKDEINDPYF